MIAMPARLQRIVPALRSLLRIGRDPLAFVVQLHKEHPDVATFQIGRHRWISVVSPELVEELLVKQKDRTTKDRVTMELEQVLGRGLLTSEGALWRRQRKLISPAFRPKDMARYGADMLRSAEEGLNQANGTVAVNRLFTSVTLAVVIRTLFGAEPDSQAGRVGPILDDLMQCFEREQRTLWRVIPKAVPARHRRRVGKLSLELSGLIEELVAQAREEGLEGRSDLLTRLLQARDDDGVGMDDTQLRDELVTLFLAGHETTSITLTLTMWLLAVHPSWQERVRDEVNGLTTLHASAVHKLPVLTAVLKESLRLFPPAWTVGREATEPFSLGGVEVEKGDQLIATQWVVHRDERLWSNPDQFDPERWLDGRAQSKHRFAYFPFGGGRRVCVGNHFAQMEALLVLAVFVRARRFTACDETQPALLPAITLRPKEDVKLTFTPV